MRSRGFEGREERKTEDRRGPAFSSLGMQGKFTYILNFQNRSGFPKPKYAAFFDRYASARLSEMRTFV